MPVTVWFRENENVNGETVDHITVAEANYISHHEGILRLGDGSDFVALFPIEKILGVRIDAAS